MKALSSPRMLTAEEGKKRQLAWDFLKHILPRSRVMQMAYQSIHVYTFSRDVYFKYSPQMVSNQEQSGQPLLVRTRLPLGAEGFFVRQAPNHKHLREPAARGAAATAFVMTLPVPQAPAPQALSRSSGNRSCLWKGQPPLQLRGPFSQPCCAGWAVYAEPTFSRQHIF